MFESQNNTWVKFSANPVASTNLSIYF